MAEFNGERAEGPDSKGQKSGGLSVSTRPLVIETGVRSMRAAFGVPRRFGIGTLLIVTAAYGALLTVLRAMDWHRGLIAACLVFVSLVGLGQMLLFRARRPRKASIVTGAVCVPVAQLLLFSLLASRDRGSLQHWLDDDKLFAWLAYSTLLGGAAGYLAGGVVAGVFLIMDAVERAIGKKRASAAR